MDLIAYSSVFYLLYTWAGLWGALAIWFLFASAIGYEKSRDPNAPKNKGLEFFLAIMLMPWWGYLVMWGLTHIFPAIKTWTPLFG